jgi:hypothetical protein
MILFAVLLVSFYTAESAAPDEPDRPATTKPAKDKEPSPAERAFARRLSVYSLILGTLLIIILCLAFLDMLATRRYTLRQIRQMHAMQDAWVEKQSARLRHPGNGQA